MRGKEAGGRGQGAGGRGQGAGSREQGEEKELFFNISLFHIAQESFLSPLLLCSSAPLLLCSSAP
ncbi:hypothetical protein COO91_10457 (plasmid) [Nostoc flagelliforme CCNUN1]|uniref:Uncharacterized protein n=1 Tax=Nostoc flagelliforme CCNUN1 TaxID=2038116 RepID=A0A2K8T962_9NOSO|nr:hypothetical protein COO91_10457 [Nostoc flagelliforme CCNUN1]